MFAKIFEQIFDSSIAENWQTRHVFEDMLKLCDRRGILDRTSEAIARRTNVPLDIVKKAIVELEQPDSRSRNPEFEGRRIVRLDVHRDWGWRIVNYEYYRQIASADQKREQTLERVKRYREREKRNVTPGNAGNAMQREMQTQKENHNKVSKPYQEKGSGEKPKSAAAIPLSPLGQELASRFETALGDKWPNDAGKWINRIKSAPGKCERVIAEVENAAKEKRIHTTPAQYAEEIWKEFR